MSRPVIRALLAVPIAASLYATAAPAVADAADPPKPFVYLHCYDMTVEILGRAPVVSVCSPLSA